MSFKAFNMFDLLLDNLTNKITSRGGNQVTIPDYFKEHHSDKNNSVIRNWLWDVPGFRRWRVTRMDAGNKMQVLNSVAYPNFKNDMPIMGIDLLWFEVKGKLVAILDFQPLEQNKNYFDKYFDKLKLLKSRFPDFSNQKDMNSYDINKYFSPWVIFCKGDFRDMNDNLPLVFNGFLDSYFELYNHSLALNSQISSDDIRRLHISYDIYNFERDPAHGLFKSYFGKEWANSFINEFLFPLKSYDQKVDNSGKS